MAIQTEKPIECVGCNTFDMKSLFDNSDCSLPIEQFYATRQDAEGALEYFTLKARDVESEPCQIQSEIQQVEEGYVLKAVFNILLPSGISDFPNEACVSDNLL